MIQDDNSTVYARGWERLGAGCWVLEIEAKTICRRDSLMSEEDSREREEGAGVR